MSRSYYGRLVPPDRAGEFYGFYNMMSKFAAVLGPFLMGTTALLTRQFAHGHPFDRRLVRRRRGASRIRRASRACERCGG